MERTYQTAMVAITALLTFQLFSRGTDYLTGNPADGNGVFSIGDGTPPALWGIALVITSIIVAAGLTLRKWGIVRTGAVMATAIYGAFSLMVADDVWVQRPIDDWRHFTLYVTMAGAWAVVAYVFSIRAAVKKSREVDHGGSGGL